MEDLPVNGIPNTNTIFSPGDGIRANLIVRYIRERRCKGGGYCFYRLEEPNGSDTYHALSSLRWLGRLERDEETAAFLLDRQAPDGSYESILQAGYCLKGLAILGMKPEADPCAYILGHLRAYDVDRLPAEVTSIFGRMLAVVELLCLRDLPVPVQQKEAVVDFLLRYRQADGGFGDPHSNLVETCQAVQMLSWLDYPAAGLGADRFLAACEHPSSGFVDLPGTTLSFLEHVHAGIFLSRILGRKVRHAAGCTEFIRACQTRNGGFSRSAHDGIATLEDTHLAVEAWSLLPGAGGRDVLCGFCMEEQILRNLADQIRAIEALRSLSPYAAAFREWHAATEQLLAAVWGENGRPAGDFRTILFTPLFLSCRSGEATFDEAYREGLREAENLLRGLAESEIPVDKAG
ncbi:MAG: prenyltransferase/squalene oxidase repeat-containing protein [Syntrophales bacterium]